LFQALVGQAAESGMACKTMHWPENGQVPEGLIKSATARPLGRGLILIHRRCVGPMEIQFISELRSALDVARTGRPKLELVVGDLVRYAEMQTLEQVVDRITPEAVMADLLPGRLARFRGLVPSPTKDQAQAQVGILSTNRDLAAILADLVQWAGFTPVLANGWSDRKLASGALVVWDVPVLSSRWLAELQAQSRRRPVVALLPMSHRDTTAQARAAGAVACLDLPFETEDLANLFIQHVPQNSTPHKLVAAAQVPPASLRLRSGSTILRPDKGHSLKGESPRSSALGPHAAQAGREAGLKESSPRVIE
jgi:hypothetical protein